MTLQDLGAEEFAAYKRLQKDNLQPGPVAAWAFVCTLMATAILQCLNYLWFYLIITTTIRKLSTKNKKELDKVD